MKLSDLASQVLREQLKQLRDAISKRPLSRPELGELLECKPAHLKELFAQLAAEGANIQEMPGGKLFLHNFIGTGGTLELQAKDRGDG